MQSLKKLLQMLIVFTVSEGFKTYFLLITDLKEIASFQTFAEM